MFLSLAEYVKTHEGRSATDLLRHHEDLARQQLQSHRTWAFLGRGTKFRRAHSHRPVDEGLEWEWCRSSTAGAQSVAKGEVGLSSRRTPRPRSGEEGRASRETFDDRVQGRCCHPPDHPACRSPCLRDDTRARAHLPGFQPSSGREIRKRSPGHPLVTGLRQAHQDRADDANHWPKPRVTLRHSASRRRRTREGSGEVRQAAGRTSRAYLGELNGDLLTHHVGEEAAGGNRKARRRDCASLTVSAAATLNSVARHWTLREWRPPRQAIQPGPGATWAGLASTSTAMARNVASSGSIRRRFSVPGSPG